MEKAYAFPKKINFWRTKDGAEVDFIIDTGLLPVPVEVKYRDLKEAEVTRSLRSFISKYHPATALVVNLLLEDTITLNKTKIQFGPFYKIYIQSLLPLS